MALHVRPVEMNVSKFQTSRRQTKQHIKYKIALITIKKDSMSFRHAKWNPSRYVWNEYTLIGAMQVPRDCPEDIVDLIHDCTQQNPTLRPDMKQCFDRIKA